MSIIKSPKKFTTVWSSQYNNGRIYDCDNRSHNLFFAVDLPKFVDGNLKCEIEFT